MNSNHLKIIADEIIFHDKIDTYHIYKKYGLLPGHILDAIKILDDFKIAYLQDNLILRHANWEKNIFKYRQELFRNREFKQVPEQYFCKYEDTGVYIPDDSLIKLHDLNIKRRGSMEK